MILPDILRAWTVNSRRTVLQPISDVYVRAGPAVNICTPAQARGGSWGAHPPSPPSLALKFRWVERANSGLSVNDFSNTPIES